MCELLLFVVVVFSIDSFNTNSSSHPAPFVCKAYRTMLPLLLGELLHKGGLVLGKLVALLLDREVFVAQLYVPLLQTMHHLRHFCTT